MFLLPINQKQKTSGTKTESDNDEKYVVHGVNDANSIDHT